MWKIIKILLGLALLTLAVFSIEIYRTEVRCIKVGETYEISYPRHGELHQESVTVGDDWGVLAETGGDYACMGLCGLGCQPLKSGREVWLYPCLLHDVCSFREVSSKFIQDEVCGDAALSSARAVVAHSLKGCD